jgi:hypothetical protein
MSQKYFSRERENFENAVVTNASTTSWGVLKFFRKLNNSALEQRLWVTQPAQNNHHKCRTDRDTYNHFHVAGVVGNPNTINFTMFITR